MADMNLYGINLGAAAHAGLDPGESGAIDLDDDDPAVEIQAALAAGLVLVDQSVGGYADVSESLKQVLRAEQVARIAAGP